MILKEHQVISFNNVDLELPPEVVEIDKKIKDDSNNGDLWMERGLALSGKRLMRQAVVSYSKAISLDPFCGIYYRHRGHRCISCREFDKAAADFTIASRIIPENWDVWYHLGLSHFLLGEYEQAEKAYEMCLKVTKTDGHMIALMDWTWRTYSRLGKVEQGTEIVSKYIHDKMDYIEPELGYYNSTLLYIGKKTIEEMDKQAHDFIKDSCISAFSVSNYYKTMGQTAKAKALLEELMLADTGNIWAYFGYIAAENELRNWK